MLATILTSCGLMMLSSCSNDDNTDTPPTDEVESQLQRMTLREKMGQMFYVRLKSYWVITNLVTNIQRKIQSSCRFCKKLVFMSRKLFLCSFLNTNLTLFVFIYQLSPPLKESLPAYYQNFTTSMVKLYHCIVKKLPLRW